VKALIDAGERIVVLDARPFEEYTTMAIPGAVNVPGAELVLCARALAPDATMRIIVNCAGRTRSLIGAQSLINANLPHRVDALRNGTMGWALAGHKLAHGQSLRFGDVTPEVLEKARVDARNVSYCAGVRRVDDTMLADLGPPPRVPHSRYKRPYEGTDNPRAAMQSYLDWEYGLVAQLARDGSHGFIVI
jgi:rhodanese-related sulfurtransferase